MTSRTKSLHDDQVRETMHVKKMKILHIYNHFVRNLGYIENCLPKEEVRRGNAVVVAVPEACAKPFDKQSLNDLMILSGQKGSCQVEPLIIGVNPFSFLDVSKLISNFKPDIVFLPYLNPAIIPVLILKDRLGYAVVSTVGMPVNATSLSIIRKAEYLLYRQLSLIIFEKKVDRFVESTQRNVERDIQEFRIASDKIESIPLGADIREFEQDREKRTATRDRLGIKPDEVVFVYAGKLTPDKKVEVLIDAFSHVLKETPHSRLLLIGSGNADYIRMLEEKLQTNGIQDRTIRLDFSPHKDLPKYYNAADVGVWPGSPSVTIQEAMACGLPVVIFKSGHTQHLLTYGNGYDFEDFVELASHLTALARDRQQREFMGEMSRRLAVEALDWSKISDRFTNLYRIVISKRDSYD